MPIVSPCYPVSSCAPFVTRSSLEAIQREFARAETQLRTSAPSLDSMLDRLFKPLRLVDAYKYFMRVIVLTDTTKSHEIWYASGVV